MPRYSMKVSKKLAAQMRAKQARIKTKGKSLPSRLRVSTTRAIVTKEVSKQQANYGENKYQGFKNFCRVPVPKPAGSQPLTYVFYNSGNALTALTEYNPMDLYKFVRGDESTERTGNYMYIRQSTINFEVQMMPISGTTEETSTFLPQVDFRVLLVKGNRKYDALGKFQDPGSSLFLDSFNTSFGYDNTSFQTYEYMNQPVNKRNWLVYKDAKFTLNTPVVESQIEGEPNSIHNNALSTKKTKQNFRFKLPIFKKCHFVNNDLNPEANVPDNCDTQWLLIVQACYTNHCYDPSGNGPRNYRVNVLGTTTARDS